MSKKCLKKRVLASALSVAMTFTLLPVQAQEAAENNSAESSSTEETNVETSKETTSTDDLETNVEVLETETTNESDVSETETVETETEETVETETTETETEETNTQSTEGKTEVWDFGAEQLDEASYANRLTADVINSWYSQTPGTLGVNLASFTDEAHDLAFADGGYSSTHRLRTVNTDLTRYDAKTLTAKDGTVLNGYIYSNKSGTDSVNISLYNCEPNDEISFYLGSNSGNASYVLTSDNTTQTFDHVYESGKASYATFYAAEAGTYKLYCANEKLVVARILRTHHENVTVNGNVSVPDSLNDVTLLFTNDTTNTTVKAKVSNGAYSAELAEGYTYTVSLVDANGYVVTSDAKVDVSENGNSFDVVIESVALSTITGKITGLDENLADLTLKLVSDEIYTPEFVIDEEGNFTVSVENGVTYTVVAEGVNDYEVTISQLSTTKSQKMDIAFAKKATYAVNIALEGAIKADLASAEFTFTNLDEEGYVYTFTGTDDIALRDGVYSVKVSNTGAFVQKLTSNVKVEGAEVTKKIAFENGVSKWDFTASDFTSGNYANVGEGSYNGLSFTNAKSHNATYLFSQSGTITIPVSGPCKIVVNASYQYSFYFENENEASVNVKTGSTSQIDSYTYAYDQGAGEVTLNVLSQSYINSIEVIDSIDYAETITVGENGDYKTINEAVEAAKKMDRTEDQRVTIEIQPGNYEEMLVIDTPNITLKNASKTPSIETKNAGVDIDENAVRITSYYGHGYTYYSMGSDCKYSDEVLAVNKENGYASFENPGSGTTNGSYWNATVVVNADGFNASGIIFENSFNQYVSEKAANDVIVAQSSAKEGSVPRAEMKAYDTTVQDKKYVERAAALAIYANVERASFDNCKFIGRQDTLYGGVDTTAAFYNCSIYGGTDYIFGGMTAVFAKCDLVFNTMEDKNDVGYITAAQQKSGRGYLMYNCTVKSTTPGVDTASTTVSKAGYFGRPWQATTSEVVFYDTIVETSADGTSLITPVAWNSSLSSTSDKVYEYGTYEVSGENNTASRASWSKVLSEPVLSDGTAISVKAFLGDWDAFASKDMTITFPDGSTETEPTPEEPSEKPSENTEFVLEASALDAFAAGTKADGEEEKVGTDNYFTLVYSAKSKIDGSNKTFEDGYASAQRINLGGVASTEKNAVKFTTSNKASVKVWWVEGGDDNRQMAILDGTGAQVAVTDVTIAKNATCISTFDLEEAGTYYLGGATNNNYIFKVEVVEEEVAEPFTETLDTASDLSAFAAGTKADGEEEKAGTDDYFTLVYSAKSKIDGSNKTFEDGYASAQRLNLGGAVSTEKNAVKFTTSNKASVKVWWVEGGDDNRQMAILDGTGAQVAVTDVTIAKNATCISTLELAEAGTYYLGGATNNNYIFKVEVTETPDGSSKPARADWSTVSAPVIESVEDSLDGNMLVTVAANIGYDGADAVVVSMMDEEGNVMDTKKSSKEGSEVVVTFAPEASGTYVFSVVATREGEEDKAAEATVSGQFVLPLEAPVVKSATNLGSGTVALEWDEVQEATSYIASVEGADISAETTDKYVELSGLTIGKTYTFTVVALRADEVSKAGTITVKVVDEKQRTWAFAAYGSSTNTSSNGYVGNINDGSVTVYSEGGKGKIVPGSTDGIAYYYTAIDPEKENFTLTADIHVDNWTLSNGQEGFGMMVSDTVGKHGDGTATWNNGYQLIATKMEYYWDGEAVTTDTSAAKISMKLGLGSIAKLGVTAQDIADIKSGAITMPQGFTTESKTLETNCAQLGAGTYNIIGNWVGSEPTGNQENLITDFKVQIQRNNTGYYLRYLDEDGNVINENKYYDLERTSLTQIDPENIYVGFFASRNARITVSNVELTTIDPADDEKAEEREIEYVYPNYTIESSNVANSADYDLVYYGNADGVLTIVNKKTGEVVVDKAEISANTKNVYPTKIALGDTDFEVSFTPNADYVPGEYKLLTSYDTITFTHTVSYKEIEGNYIYVAPNAKADGKGTKADPVDVYTAVKYVKAGQTIVLAGGEYLLSKTIKTERGINGTADAMIYMIADPNASERPVFNFQGKCAGMILAGDYWYFKGFDVTKSADAQKGIQVSGSHNTLDQICAYKNGNTGIQISRYMGTDAFDQWPAYNYILNCTSYLNADKGYEDADGFAAKLTVGNGNVFDGCMSYYNADDGWDLFAKVQSGSIGSVTIKNSVAFMNGYVLKNDAGELDINGKLVDAGNGNGFKMGGDSMPGAHVLENSVAFANKAKGFDSNSCPDIKVYNSTSFDNESYNVAMYTNTAVNTAYFAQGILSYKKANNISEQFKLLGSQVESDVKNATNYYFDGTKSSNTEGTTVTDEWFVNMDTQAAIKSLMTNGRNADGTINLGDYLKVTDLVPEGVGARISGTASKDFDVKEEETKLETVRVLVYKDGEYTTPVATKFFSVANGEKFDISSFDVNKVYSAENGFTAYGLYRQGTWAEYKRGNKQAALVNDPVITGYTTYYMAVKDNEVNEDGEVIKTVTYTDGVAAALVFADQVYAYTDLAELPEFDGTPVRSGYRFAGWSEAVLDENGNAVVTAQWTKLAPVVVYVYDKETTNVTSVYLTNALDVLVGEEISSEAVIEAYNEVVKADTREENFYMNGQWNILKKNAYDESKAKAFNYTVKASNYNVIYCVK